MGAALESFDMVDVDFSVIIVCFVAKTRSLRELLMFVCEIWECYCMT